MWHIISGIIFLTLWQTYDIKIGFKKLYIQLQKVLLENITTKNYKINKKITKKEKIIKIIFNIF